ncbi:hypothetical protein [Legionella oakridgensis]|uniref:hypothetical protein n=1 Tax=Legionella oakridgensis TaxID=29423 RepID=UPI0004B9D5F0|nr:hypothetical protein [Legionella oakridgensis]
MTCPTTSTQSSLGGHALLCPPYLTEKSSGHYAVAMRDYWVINPGNWIKPV